MTDPVLHPAPPFRGVLHEQVRAVGGALRLPAIAAAVLMALATVLFAGEVVGEGAVADFHPERWVLPGVVGLLLPIGVWMWEKPFADAFLWTLPVGRRRHALAKAGAGWAWLMAAVGVFVLWLLVMALVSGGNVLGEETVRFAAAIPEMRPLDPAAVRTLQWAPRPVLWLVPFVAATATYLLATALALGTRYPWRWLVGVVLGFFLIAIVSEATHALWLGTWPAELLKGLIYGRYGLETLLIANTESLRSETLLTTGEAVRVWQGVPDAGRWVAAAVLWLALGLLALWAAAARHRETRRG
ncbi:MAG TPA: hypothetical protein VFT45_26390 [Longimicrobium sp.]|nr:hypothetical protein [Longimicrobium sp.]